MELKAVLVDDEAQSREILENYLLKYCKGVKIAGQASNINEALEVIGKTDPDLLFLDVEMPFGNAFDCLKNYPIEILRSFLLPLFSSTQWMPLISMLPTT